MIHVVLFFPCLWFLSQWVFLEGFLMRQHQESVSLSIALFFLPLSFCPIGFYLVGVFLMRHMFSLGHPSGSVMNILWISSLLSPSHPLHVSLLIFLYCIYPCNPNSPLYIDDSYFRRLTFE